jgi:hypothetical protein
LFGYTPPGEPSVGEWTGTTANLLKVVDSAKNAQVHRATLTPWLPTRDRRTLEPERVVELAIKTTLRFFWWRRIRGTELWKNRIESIVIGQRLKAAIKRINMQDVMSGANDVLERLVIDDRTIPALFGFAVFLLGLENIGFGVGAPCAWFVRKIQPADWNVA